MFSKVVLDGTRETEEATKALLKANRNSKILEKGSNGNYNSRKIVIILSSKTNTSASVDYTKTLNALLRNHCNSQKKNLKLKKKKKTLLTAWINLNKKDETSKCETLKIQCK
jgi:hypothetical protein